MTGVSTGALAAPFVFLGPDRDAGLREAYNGGLAANLLQGRGLGAFVGSGIYQSAPLRALIETFVDAAMLTEIAAEHRRGRILLVATTALDAQRGVVWNMGAIAERGGPEALALFRDILTASASIPGAFPPVMINARASDALDSPAFEEMRVDGGVMNPFVAVPGGRLYGAPYGRGQGGGVSAPTRESAPPARSRCPRRSAAGRPLCFTAETLRDTVTPPSAVTSGHGWG